MIQADKRVMQAFVSPEGQIIRDFLTKCYEAKAEELMLAIDEVPMFRAQGAGNELKEVVTLANNSHNILHST